LRAQPNYKAVEDNGCRPEIERAASSIDAAFLRAKEISCFMRIIGASMCEISSDNRSFVFYGGDRG
jgi:hypothetical protein